VFLCHGYNGYPEDLRFIYNSISMKNPLVKIHSLNSFGLNRDESIENIGKIVSKEIINVIDVTMIERSVDKITFYGYSMGGLVIRAALPHLKSYKKYFDTIITCATPHLGYITTKSGLLTAGMWFAGRFNSRSSISEITLSDNWNIKECSLYKLSKKEGLDWFKTGNALIIISQVYPVLIHDTLQIQA
jgi:triacylglycerol esterase/lipase EstA (alpha/beta hydrolase family)